MIYTLTLNPAVDRELTVPEIRFDAVTRASKSRVDVGGKGFNVSRLLQHMGMSSTAIGFAGGRAGELLKAGLEGLGIRTAFVWVLGETRTNLSIVTDLHEHYVKVNEAGPTIDQAQQNELIEKIAGLAQRGDWWVLAGSLPPGADIGLYARLVYLIQSAGARAVLDTAGAALRLACTAAPYLVKPNAEEARAITGLPTNSTAEAARASAEILRLGAQNVVISLGKRGAVLISAEGRWLARSPGIRERNPIGAGDSLVGGMVWALSQEFSLREALGWGVASGAATASLDGTEVGSRGLVEELFSQVTYDEIK